MSCADVQTIQAGNGSKTQFSFDFPYLFKTEIEVSFWNATTKEWDVKATTDATYPWRVTDANPTIVEFTSTAPPSPATPTDPGESTVDNVRIRRNTSIADIRALFSPGSAIRSDDLNKNFEQLRYAIQESNCEGISDEVYQYLLDYYWDRFDNTLYSADTWRSDDATIATTAALDQRFQDEVNDTLTKAELAALSDVMPDDDVAVPTTGATKDYIDHVIETDILVDGTGLNKSGSGGQVTIGISAGSVDLDRIKAEDIITSAESNPNNDTTIATTAKIDDMIDEAITNDIGTDGTGITVTDDGDGTITLGLADNSIDFSKIKDDDIITYAEQNAGSPAWNSDDRLATTWAASKRFDTIVQTATPTGTDWQIGKTWLQNDSNKTLSIWNGSTWLGIASGGTFTTQPSVIYVDSLNGDDANDGHRIITPKATIKNAVADANDGDIIIVAPGVYQETLPIDITVNNLSIVGSSQRSCFIIPAVGDEEEIMFRCNSGTYIDGFTFTGLKASGTRGNNALDDDPTYGLPENQGWVAGFYPGCTILKSPYINNCTSYMDSAVDVSNFDPNNPAGTGGDTTSNMTGGGVLVDGSVPATASPLRSFVVNEFTQVNLDGPGLLVTNNGYAQAVSFFALFCHYHAKALNGGQINMEVGTTDFGRYGLIADGKSSSTIFTATADGAASTGATSFLINAPSASAGWFGSATRPANTMLVEVGGNIYPILSSSANGSGWSVVVSNPDTNNRNVNNGLVNGHSSGAAVNFYLRSQISAAAHTFEYAGSGVNYTALPQNGGVANESNQVVQTGAAAIAGNQTEGAVFYSSTDENGKFKVGDTFQVDQKTGFVTIDPQSYSTNLVSDLTPQLGGDLDVQTFDITTSTTNGDIVLNPNGTGQVNISSSGSNSSPALVVGGDADTGIYSPGADQVAISTGGAERLRITADGKVGIGSTTDPGSYNARLWIDSTADTTFTVNTTGSTNISQLVFRNSNVNGEARLLNGTGGPLTFFRSFGNEAARIDTSGRLGLGTSSPYSFATFNGGDASGFTDVLQLSAGAQATNSGPGLTFNFNYGNYAAFKSWQLGTIRAGASFPSGNYEGYLSFYTNTGSSASSITEKLRITDDGKVGIGTTSPGARISLGTSTVDSAASDVGAIRLYDDGAGSAYGFGITSGQLNYRAGGDIVPGSHVWFGGTTERMRLDGSGRLGLGTSSPNAKLQVGAVGVVGGLSPVAYFVSDTDASGDAETEIAIGQSGTSVGSWVALGAGVTSGANPYFFIKTRPDAGGNSVERLRIDGSGRVGISTTPKPWVFKVLEVGGANLASSSSGAADSFISANAYYDGSWKYRNAGVARNIYMNTDGIVFRQAASGSADAAIAWSEHARIDTNGYLRLSSSSPGIQFNGDTAAANALDDYEEGTWTPNQGAGLTVNGTFSSSGFYTKIGRLVTVQFELAGSTDISCSAGGIFCTNLPFAGVSLKYQCGSATNSSYNVSNGCMAVGATGYIFEAFTTTLNIHGTITYMTP